MNDHDEDHDLEDDAGTRNLPTSDPRRARYLAGEEYSIADIATYPWLVSGAEGVDLAEYAGVRRWMEAVGARPAVQRGMSWLKNEQKQRMDERAQAHLFGQQTKA